MKKLALLSLLALPVGTASAQQIGGSFDDEWETCTPYLGSGSYYTNGVGQQPIGWKASNLYQLWVSAELVESTDGVTGQGVYMHNQFVGFSSIGENAPAYLSLGTPWSAANAVGIVVITEQDGGTFGGLDFTYRPDSVRFSYKRAYGTETQEDASVIAYLWKGQYSSNVGVGVSFSSPTKETMIDRDRDVLGMITEGVTTSDDAECIASLNYSIEGEQAEWATLSIPFEYTSDATPEKINVIFSAADYFGDREAIGAGNSLTIDNVVLVYNSQLSSLTYGGVDINGFAADNYETLDMTSEVFDADKLAYASNGAGATVETSFDEATGLLTLTVKGNDYDTNTDNVHVYTVQFSVPLVSGISVAGEVLAGFDPNVTEYTLPFPYDASVVVSATTAEGVTATTATGDEQTIILTATDGTDTVAYTFRFTDAVADAPLGGTYDGSLSVVLMGAGTELANAPIVLSVNEDGTANLRLEDFTFAGTVNVGDIYVPGLPFSEDGDTIRGTRIISFPYGMASSLLGQLPVTVSARVIGEGEIEADIDIDTEGTLVSSFGTIHVDFTPLVLGDAATDDGLVATGRLTGEGAGLLALSSPQDKRYVDLSGAAIDDDVTLSTLFGGNDAPNTLVYAPASATLGGDNVVLGDNCAKLVLTDSVDFRAPYAFTASEVSFDREFAAGQTATFVMPFSFDVPEGTTVSQLTGVAGSVLTFTPVDAAAANTPYLIEAGSSRPFDGLTDVSVAATDTASVTVGSVTHYGAYATAEVASDVTTTYYAWDGDGGFVQADTVTNVPFRTYLAVPSADVAAYSVAITPTVGIGNATSDSADETLYDLSGRRVVKAGKGIYIRGGKKVYVK